MQGRAFLVSFLATEKRDSPGKAKQKLSTELGNRLGHKPSSLWPAFGQGLLRRPWRLKSPLQGTAERPYKAP
jgi:hypothetical protein